MAMTCRFSTPRAVSTSATIRVPRSSSAVRVTCSPVSVMASMTPSSPGASRRARRSSSHHGVPKPLMRTQARRGAGPTPVSSGPAPLREPETPPGSDESHSITFRRARCLSAGATESSTSRITTSAALVAATSKRAGWVPLTSSHERASSGPMEVRCRVAVVVSDRVVDMIHFTICV